MNNLFSRASSAGPLISAALLVTCGGIAHAHHSFAMYDTSKTFVVTGVVTRIDPNPNHLQIFFAPLNKTRDRVIRDQKGEPIVWAVEMESAAQSAKIGITVNNFPRGTIFSVGLHPLRNGKPGGARVPRTGVFKCPAETPPAAGKDCSSVKGATSHGQGPIPKPTEAVPGTE